ncbi:MAG TPA: monovalent cation/H(+) antiporter subunit G [Planctomycetota bacterium]|nr:monovalent cation/H(+) antiporter subunit G [Planctomycetota bacterium]
MSELLAYIVITVGLAFDVFGTVGLVRLPDIYNRVQAATKCVTLGTCFILLGVAIYAFGHGLGAMCVKALLCAAFVLLTSPVGAHAVARGAHVSGVQLWEGSVMDKYKDDFGQPEKELDDHER